MTPRRPAGGKGRAGMAPPREEEGPAQLLGIGKAAAECGVSERALRYYQQIGLLTPTGITPGGMRRYSEADLARVRRIRDLQSLLGFNLDEIRVVLVSDDRLAAIKEQYLAATAGSSRRLQLLRQALAVREELAATIDTKIAALHGFRSDLEVSMQRVRSLLEQGEPGAEHR